MSLSMKKSNTIFTEDSSTEEMLSPKDAAKMLMISPVTLRQWAQKGLIPAYQTIGGHRRFKTSEILKLLEQNNQKSKLTNKATKILIIDDDEGLLKLLSTVLKERYSDNVIIEVSSNGFDGGLKVVMFKPDILILDLMMNGMNGFEVCQKVKQNQQTSKIRILTMTGYPSKDNKDKIISLGAEICFAKPLDFNEVYKYIDID